MLTNAPKGTKDMLPQDAYKWKYVRNAFADICAKYSFKQIATPVFEHTEQAEIAAERDQQRDARLVSQSAPRALVLRDDLLRIAAARERLLSGAALRGGRLLCAEVVDGAAAAVVE